MRRADRYARRATIAALEAVKSLAPGEQLPDETGVVVAGAFGPHRTTFAFLDSLLDFPDQEASPTLFSHSVHNAAASYVAATLGVHGPCMAIAVFDNAWYGALVTAEDLLWSGSCRRVLVVGVDELALLTEAAVRMTHDFGPGCDPLKGGLRNPPSEGAVAMVLAGTPGGRVPCRVSSSRDEDREIPDVVVASGVERSRVGELFPAARKVLDLGTRCGFHLFGNGLETVASALMVSDGEVWSAIAGDSRRQRGVACVNVGPFATTTSYITRE
jgi:hypothetical protein